MKVIRTPEILNAEQFLGPDHPLPFGGCRGHLAVIDSEWSMGFPYTSKRIPISIGDWILENPDAGYMVVPMKLFKGTFIEVERNFIKFEPSTCKWINA
jgi:hypothetical protein